MFCLFRFVFWFSFFGCGCLVMVVLWETTFVFGV